MGRSNNQRRRHAKEHGGTFLPKTTKSRLRNTRNQQRVHGWSRGAGQGGKGKNKLAYSKIVTKHGKVKQRKFRSGGYNNSGKSGSARGAKMRASAGKKGKA